MIPTRPTFPAALTRRSPHDQRVTPQPARYLAALCAAWALSALPALAWAQTPEAEPRPSPKVEHIVHEDGGSRVQELRVGGQTREIEVQSKADVPPYHINPAAAVQGPAHPDGQRTGTAGTAGRTTWRLFNF